MKTVTVAEFKRRFSEFVADVRYRGERVIIARRRTPVAALIGLDELEQLSRHQTAGGHRRGLLAAIGAWGDDEELDHLIHDIYAARASSVDRPVSLPS
jgi:prevent-host-death family protein